MTKLSNIFNFVDLTKHFLSMRAKIIICFCVLASILTFSQKRIYPIAVKNCSASKYCIDCGTTKATYDPKTFNFLLEKLNRDINLIGIKADRLRFQVIIDGKTRKACVASHNDENVYSFTKVIISELNQFSGWRPAKNGNVNVPKSSINILFDIKNNKLTGGQEGIYDVENDLTTEIPVTDAIPETSETTKENK